MPLNIFKKNSESGHNHKMLSLSRWKTLIFLMEDPFKRPRVKLSPGHGSKSWWEWVGSRNQLKNHEKNLTDKVSEIPKTNTIFTCLLLFRMLVNLPILMFVIVVQLILPVLLTPTNCCFHDQVKPPLPGVLSIKWIPLNIATLRTHI